MALHLQREIEKLKKQILALSAIVEENVYRAVKAVRDRDAELAREVIAADETVDRTEVDIEEDCHKLLALYQPVAFDLRFIIAVLKINDELERIGDLAVNIAERALYLSAEAPIDIPFDFPGMVAKVRTMLRQSLDALVNLDAELALHVCASDDEVDALNREMYGQVKKGILECPDHIESLIHLLSVSRHLERIADLTTYIAEDVVYMTTGQIIRHRIEEYRPAAGEPPETTA